MNFGLEVTQKVPYWLRLTATGEPGHGSRPLVSYASTEMIAALERFRLHQFEAAGDSCGARAPERDRGPAR